MKLRFDGSAKFILRFDFPDITVLYAIWKRYRFELGCPKRAFLALFFWLEFGRTKSSQIFCLIYQTKNGQKPA